MKRPLARLAGALAPAAAILALLAFGFSPALAAGPALELTAISNSSAPAGGTLRYVAQVASVGEAPTDGSAIDLRVALAPGIGALNATNVAGSSFACTAGDEVSPVAGATTLDCKTTQVLPRTHSVGVVVEIALAASASGVLTSKFAVSGGGAEPQSTVRPIQVSPSAPPFGIEAFDFRPHADPAGTASTQAGAHPYDLSTYIDFNSTGNPNPALGPLWPVQPVKDILVDLPPGAVGAPSVADRCTIAQLANSGGIQPKPLCPAESQLGTVMVRALGVAVDNGSVTTGPLPLYNLVPPDGVPAEFGFNVYGSVVTLSARTRSGGDYGLSVTSANTPEALAIVGTTVTFWGTPADHSHDLQRACPGEVGPWQEGPFCASAKAPEAFLRNPTACTGSTATTLHVDSWADPGAFDAEGGPLPGDSAWRSATVTSHQSPGYPASPADPTTPWGAPVGQSGCAAVPFTPSIVVRPTTDVADSPTGLDVDLTMPQEALRDPGAIAQADVKDTVVTQPVGTRVNPAAADGLVGCSEAEIGLIGTGFPAPNPIHFTSAEPTCPDASKIGSVEIESPLLPDKMTGSIYQARQDQNPFGATLAFYAVAAADGVVIKLPAEVRTDPGTGQVTTIFKDNPQLPFEHYKLHFAPGPRAPLITPARCGSFTTEATFTGWANPDAPVQGEDSFQIARGPDGAPCPASDSGRPFAPGFEAGTANPLAGAFSPFALRLSRADGMQELTGLRMTMPPGLLGRLAGIPYCPEAAIAAASAQSAAAELAAPSCPAASRLGSSDSAAGAGPQPFHLQGSAYLAGPYKGAPLSLVVITPAAAGPLDLGTVVVRAALAVDPTTAQVTANSDPFPLAIQKGGDGFPLDLRLVDLNLDRPGFTLNPTSCDPMAVTAVVGGTNGASADVSSRFQVGGCEKLAFKPSLSLRLEGRTRRSGHPALTATLKMPAGADVAAASVALPHSEFLAQNHIRTVCTRVQFAAGGGGGEQCPPGSVYGHAVAYSPLLDAPLEGNVYLRSSSHPLPDLVASLDGQIHIDLLGRIDSHEGGIRTSFETAPDAPVSKFVLSMQGGRKGLLENSTDICAGTHRATARFEAHNGKARDLRPRLRAGCSKGGRGKRRQHR